MQMWKLFGWNGFLLIEKKILRRTLSDTVLKYTNSLNSLWDIVWNIDYNKNWNNLKLNKKRDI
jgi:hypothetical protein